MIGDVEEHRGTRAGDSTEDTYGRAQQLVDSVEFRVVTETQLEVLEARVESARRWAFVIISLLVLNWLHDLGATAEMLDWWDGREAVGGLLSTEIEHEITVMMPLLLAIIPILWGRRRDRLAKQEADKK